MFILIDPLHHIVAETAGIFGIVRILLILIGFAVDSYQSFLGTYPKIVFFVGVNSKRRIGGKGFFLAGEAVPEHKFVFRPAIFMYPCPTGSYPYYIFEGIF